MLVHSYYEEDARVRRQAEALVASGRPVDVYGLWRPGDGREGVIEGVHLRRLDVQRHQGAGAGRYLSEYVDFFVRAGLSVTSAHRQRHYALLQVHTLPDFLIFAGLPLRLAGVPLVLDLHEARPEFMRSRFPNLASPAALGLLRLQERLSIGAADAVITVNSSLGDRLVALGTPSEKLTIVLNSPSLRLFDPGLYEHRPFMADGCLRLIYAGAVTPTYELEVVLAAVARLRAIRPGLGVMLDIYGRGDAEEPLRARAAELAIDDAVRFHGRIPLEDVPAAIAASDVGLAPTRQNRFTDFSLSTKVFEYAAMRRPVVATRLQTVERYFAPDTAVTYRPGDADDLASAILGLVDDPEERDRRVIRTGARVAELGWDREASRFVELIERTIAGRRRRMR